MKQYRCDTVIITKEGWKYLLQRAFAQGSRGKNLPEESMERAWNRKQNNRNGGASPIKNPIAENEIRVNIYDFGLSVERVKELLDEQGMTWREDGFITEDISV